MENKIKYQAELFSNRLKKKYKELRKWARKNRVSCYCLYDRDIPEIPVSVDLYEFLPTDIQNSLEVAQFLNTQNEKLSQNVAGIELQIKERTFAVLYLYERPYEKSDEEEEIWLNEMANSLSQVLQIPLTQIIKKYRKHQSHKDGEQYKKEQNKGDFNNQNEPLYGASENFEWVQECGQLFKINLNSYLDNGLFFDHRPLRSIIRDTCSNKSVLNLFCYTGSFSVYAASGNAKSVESVDLSNTYLDWAKENMKKNGFSDKNKYVFTRSDCIHFLQEKAVSQKKLIANPTDKEAQKNSKTYDIIILDPPTFSNSKNTVNVLDINKDWAQLVKDCLNILNDGGILYFSTNSERLKFDVNQLPPKTIKGNEFTCQDITTQTISHDYEGSKPHRCWKFTLV